MDRRDGRKARITSRPYGKLQVVRSKRKIFGKERQERFLDELGATCNVEASARAAGVTAQCVYQRRRRDPDFRNAWWERVEEAYAALELRMLEEASKTARTRRHAGEPGRVAAGSTGKFDRELSLHLLREHKKGLAGVKRRGVPELRAAEWTEVERYFIARLRALNVRLDRDPGKRVAAQRGQRRGSGGNPRGSE